MHVPDIIHFLFEKKKLVLVQNNVEDLKRRSFKDQIVFGHICPKKHITIDDGLPAGGFPERNAFVESTR